MIVASHGEVLKHRPCCGQYGKVHLFYSGDFVADDGTAQCVDDRWHAGWCHDVRGHRLGERYLTAHAPAHKVGA
jgi:hypothetical protein